MQCFTLQTHQRNAASGVDEDTGSGLLTVALARFLQQSLLVLFLLSSVFPPPIDLQWKEFSGLDPGPYPLSTSLSSGELSMSLNPIDLLMTSNIISPCQTPSLSFILECPLSLWDATTGMLHRKLQCNYTKAVLMVSCPEMPGMPSEPTHLVLHLTFL